MNNRLYTIKEVSLRTGLSTQLIRKWEERYSVVKPSRFPNGYRGYTKDNIDTLIWLKSRVDAGVPIGLAVQDYQVSGDASGRLEEPLRAAASPPTEASGTEAEGYQQQFLQCFVRLDYRAAQQLFDQLTALHQLDFVLMRVLRPTLVELGERWLRGEISEYQEHFGSHFVRDRLLAMKNIFLTSPEQPLLVTACSPYERHEIGVLFFGFYALQQGFQIVYLGTSPSEKGILDCLGQFRPHAFAFSVSTMHVYNDSLPFFRRLDAEITKRASRTKVFVGGRAVMEDGVLPGTRHIYLMTGDAKDALAKIKALVME
ncbi:cobalamin B12-binding domain-containing protein [Paenibacillus sp. TRM 82003]|nr:cobalamin B12-binding domain-containing protein [Paenibacillus sp. TRM 82003]